MRQALILELFQQLSTESGTSMIIVTHNPNLASAQSRQVALHDGRLTQVELS